MGIPFKEKKKKGREGKKNHHAKEKCELTFSFWNLGG
jgi:hypothetical protein